MSVQCATGKLLLCGIILLPACGGSAKTFPVEGSIEFRDGTSAKELAGRVITFRPAAGDALPQGEIQPDGSFRLRTFQPGDGAPAGQYQVAIGPDNSTLPPPPPCIAKTYHDPNTSGLQAVVEPRATRIKLIVDRLETK